MTREEAWKMITHRLGESATLAHCLAVEACMRALAARFGMDEDLFGVTGLVHDLDLNECGDDLTQHTLIAAQVLKEMDAPVEMIEAVLGHNDKAPRTTLLAKALWVVDPTTGFITAAALIRPSRSTSDLSVQSIKKRMKDKRFAAAVNRDQIRACESQLGIELDEFLNLCLEAMDKVREKIGLDGPSPD